MSSGGLCGPLVAIASLPPSPSPSLALSPSPASLSLSSFFCFSSLTPPIIRGPLWPSGGHRRLPCPLPLFHSSLILSLPLPPPLPLWFSLVLFVVLVWAWYRIAWGHIKPCCWLTGTVLGSSTSNLVLSCIHFGTMSLNFSMLKSEKRTV